MPKEAKPSSSLRLRGAVRAFNVSPKGHIEGVLLDTASGRAQINFSQHAAESLARSMNVGSDVDLEVEREPGRGHHHVYRATDAVTEVSGRIEGLNHALHGEVNGYRLESGTFLHVKPGAAKKLDFQVGETVKASGEQRRGRDAVVVDVRTVERL